MEGKAQRKTSQERNLDRSLPERAKRENGQTSGKVHQRASEDLQSKRNLPRKDPAQEEANQGTNLAAKARNQTDLALARILEATAESPTEATDQDQTASEVQL